MPGKKGVAKSDRSRMSSYTSAHFGLQLSSPASSSADETAPGPGCLEHFHQWSSAIWAGKVDWGPSQGGGLYGSL